MWPFRKKPVCKPAEEPLLIVLPKPKHIEKLYQRELQALSENLSDELSDKVNRDINDITDEEWDTMSFISDEADKLQKAICKKYSHTVVDDHCGKIEHRYCLYCRESLPGEEPSNEL